MKFGLFTSSNSPLSGSESGDPTSDLDLSSDTASSSEEDSVTVASIPPATENHVFISVDTSNEDSNDDEPTSEDDESSRDDLRVNLYERYFRHM